MKDAENRKDAERYRRGGETLFEWCGEWVDDLAQLGRNSGQSHLLEGSIGVPFLADRGTQTLLVLGPGLERVGNLRYGICRSLLVAPLVNNDMRQLGILALARLDTISRLRLLHNNILLLLGSLSSP